MNKKRGIAIFLTIILLATLVTAASLSKEDRALISECRSDCRSDQRAERTTCRDDYKDCRTTCKEEYDQCQDDQKEILDQCTENCETTITDRGEKRSCITSCKKEYTLNRRNLCSHNDCRSECTSEYRDCRNEVKDKYKDCQGNCKYTALNSNITCEGGKYKGGEQFLEGCEVCTCGFDSEIECEKTDYCNFESVDVEEETCVEAGGFYQMLCKGPYFGIGCSQKSFCQCEGNFDYACPADHTCVKDFKEPRIKRTTIPGWRTLRGIDLGDIGLCAPNPELPNCGDGTCDNLLAPGSEVAETSLNCPADCS